MDDLLQPLPLARSGGVFLAIVGAAMVMGAARFPHRYLILGIGAAIASIALALTAYPLAAPFGPPSALQIASLAIAVVAEIVAFVWLAPKAARHGERAHIATIFAIVAAHLLIMAPAFGPLIVLLGLIGLANAAVAARLTSYPLPLAWAVDGVSKFSAGAALFLIYAPR